mgnify:CR=1 FL=1
MSRTLTSYVNVRRLLQEPGDAAHVLRIAMAADDMAVANFCMQKAMPEEIMFPR